MAFRFSTRSNRELASVHPQLQRLARAALAHSPVDFMVIEGRRTLERQKQLKAAGASRTLKSKHITGHAIDVAALVDGKVRFDWPVYRKVAAAFEAASKETGVKYTWGGGWKSFPDGPHFEIDPKAYPWE